VGVRRAHPERLELDRQRAEVGAGGGAHHAAWCSFSKFSTSTIRFSSSDTGAPSIFQYSLMKSDHGSSEPKITRSPPTPCFSISTSSQRAPKPIAQEVSVYTLYPSLTHCRNFGTSLMCPLTPPPKCTRWILQRFP